MSRQHVCMYATPETRDNIALMIYKENVDVPVVKVTKRVDMLLLHAGLLSSLSWYMMTH